MFDLIQAGKANQVTGKVNTRLETLSGQFGAANVEALTPQVFKDIQDFKLIQSKSTLMRQQMQASLFPTIARAIHEIPNGANVMLNMMGKVHAQSVARVSGRWTGVVGGGDLLDMAMRGALIQRGAALLQQEDPDFDIEKNQDQALMVGARLFESEVQREEKHFLDKMQGIIGSVLETDTITQVNKANALINMFNDLWDEDGTLNQVGIQAFIEPMAELDQAYEDETQTSLEDQDAINLLTVLGRAGMFGPELEGKDPEEVMEILGTRGTEMLRGIKAPEGSEHATDMYDLFFDSKGILRPNSKVLLFADRDKLKEFGDPTVWDFFANVTTNMEPGAYEGKNGFFEDSVEAIADASRPLWWQSALQNATKEAVIEGAKGADAIKRKFGIDFGEMIQDRLLSPVVPFGLGSEALDVVERAADPLFEPGEPRIPPDQLDTMRELAAMIDQKILTGTLDPEGDLGLDPDIADFANRKRDTLEAYNAAIGNARDVADRGRDIKSRIGQRIADQFRIQPTGGQPLPTGPAAKDEPINQALQNVRKVGEARSRIPLNPIEINAIRAVQGRSAPVDTVPPPGVRRISSSFVRRPPAGRLDQGER
jgi:hypothetical protein